MSMTYQSASGSSFIGKLGKAIARLVLATCAAAAPASAQVSESVDSSLLENWRLSTGNIIRFCQYEAAPTFEFDRALAEAMAQRLLVGSEFEGLGASYGIGGEYAAEDLFISLTNRGDVVMGMGLAANLYPVEFTATRSYVGFPYVLVVDDEDIEALREIPSDQRVGALVGSFGFRALVRYIATMPEDRQWQALPYGSTELMITRLLDDTIGGMVVYGPSFLQHRHQAPRQAELYVRPLPAEMAANVEIGAVMLSRNAYLRTLLDQAITDMVADGTIQQLLVETGLDTVPHAPGGFQ